MFHFDSLVNCLLYPCGIRYCAFFKSCVLREKRGKPTTYSFRRKEEGIYILQAYEISNFITELICFSVVNLKWMFLMKFLFALNLKVKPKYNKTFKISFVFFRFRKVIDTGRKQTIYAICLTDFRYNLFNKEFSSNQQ